MPLVVNLCHLEAHSIHLRDSLSVEELDIETHDKVIQLHHPLDYDLEAQKLDDALLLQGRLQLVLDCQCVRCLKAFPYRLQLDHWTCHLPLHGEDAVAVVNDCVDLTPYVREDILLEFPRHPLCNPACRGLPGMRGGKLKTATGPGQSQVGSPAWAELDKLKL